METQKITIEMTDADRKEFVRLCKKVEWECLPYDAEKDENLPEVRFRFKEQGRLVDASVFKYLLFKLINAVAGDEVEWVSDTDDATKPEPESEPKPKPEPKPESEPTPQPHLRIKNSRRAQLCLQPALKRQLQEWADKKHLPYSCAIDHIVYSTLKRKGGQQIAVSEPKFTPGVKMPTQEAYLYPATWRLVDANIGRRAVSEFLRATIETFFNFNHQPSTKE